MKSTTPTGRLLPSLRTWITRHSRPVVSAAAVWLLVAPAVAFQNVDGWSRTVWELARSGDRDALLRQFEDAPIDAVPIEDGERFRESVEARLSNRAAAEAERLEAREQALTELREHMEAQELTKALHSAVELQTHSASLEEVFDVPEVIAVIEWAKRDIPDVKQAEDWLLARDLLFAVRTLYEDTGRHSEYELYNSQLELVNQRVALLARYAPKQLHELRARTLERIGDDDDEQPAFNPGLAQDWRERLDGVSLKMLQDALTAAARRHIETNGWRPLLEGGIESLQVFATTSLLDATFPSLTDAKRVDRWVAALDEQRQRLAQMDDRQLDRRFATELLDRIRAANQQTIQIQEEVLYREFGDGAMNKLDQFSEIIWPDKLRRFRQATEGNFVGVGIMIRNNEKQEIVVVNPLEGTPAYYAGIKPEDVIIEVDGESTVGWSLNEAVDRITGPKGVTVKLGVRRDGADGTLYFPIVRDEIKLRTVYGWWKTGLSRDGEPQWDWYIDPASQIAYVKLTGFNEDTYSDLLRAWREIIADGKPNGLIVDLRYNPGGLLTSAVQISNLFVNHGMIVSGENKDGSEVWRQSARPQLAEFGGVPTVVLINKGSASGSEIVAGALQAHGAALIIGERSYGKGSVQTVEPLQIRRGQPVAALKLTTQYYRLPPERPGQSGRLVHRRPGADVWGVDPDLEVPMSTKQIEKAYFLRQEADLIPEDEHGRPNPDAPDRPNINDLLTKGIDPQVEMALLVLQARALAPIAEDHRRAAR